jgi:hypothetical protein
MPGEPAAMLFQDLASAGATLGGVAGFGSLAVMLFRRARADGGESARIGSLETRMGAAETDIKVLSKDMSKVDVLAEKFDGMQSSINGKLSELTQTIERLAPRRVTRPRE